MSVHGEYSRALETLVTLVQHLEDPRAPEWVELLEHARVEEQRDLTGAARCCIAALDRVEAVPEASPTPSDPSRPAGDSANREAHGVVGSHSHPREDDRPTPD
ncbi:MAG: hypothetical protein CL908_10180 [Deltaproteobacteria bacterium]|nr:hypothetical protein [Deltaproteobacteria bacterium]